MSVRLGGVKVSRRDYNYVKGWRISNATICEVKVHGGVWGSFFLCAASAQLTFDSG